MPRPLRIQSAGYLHHVISKGNDGQIIFKSKDDFSTYISLLAFARKEFPVYIYNYVLMDNHVHLLLEPIQDGSMSKFMEYVSKEYAKYFNLKYERTGHVFQGRFKSLVIQTERYFFTCSRYIDLNPINANMVSNPAKYPYSGYAHLAQGEGSLLKLDKHDLYVALGKNDTERQIAYRTLVLNFQGEEIDFMTKRAGILGDSDFKDKLRKR